MATYFKVLNLDKKQRGMLAVRTGDSVSRRGGYLVYQSKEEAGAIFFEACGVQWGSVGTWFGDRVVIICDNSETREATSSLGLGDLWHESREWPEVYFVVKADDVSWTRGVPA